MGLPAICPSRRRFLTAGAASAAGLAVPGLAPLTTASCAAAATVDTNARLVIVGGGSAGTSLANRLTRATRGARITIVDPSGTHRYQPGDTLVATGVWEPQQLLRPQAAFLPDAVTWVREAVAAFDPETNRVVTETGRAITYDFLIVATGLIFEFERIEGMEPDLIGREGIGSVYGNAAATWPVLREFIQTGGVGLFGRPPGELKCAGAPLKVTFLAIDQAQRAGTRDRLDFIFNAESDRLFSVPVYHDFVEQRLGELGVTVNRSFVLTGIDPGARTATYRTPAGPVTLGYDFIHVVPPMVAPRPVRDSPLAWQEGRYAEDGWLEADPDTLRHPRYPNVFGAGDVLGVPRGKTAASVKAQVPVVTENLLSVIAGGEPTARFNGYTSCPLITRIGAALLVEFDYDGNLTPTLPFVDPTRESWLPWLLKTRFLQPTYYAMLRGHV
ncbi:MAG: NAD(P)/FAD-dependent oxidoreductase [Rhodospirillales bacterium]|nr:MAG: NAD(P)/FAD-dependent oxidoreductase [Rhodospirillales bacterium]